jgi:hypothetical protein
MSSTRHLKRWIKASFIKEVRLHLDGVPVFVEGDDRLPPNQKHIEFRIDGPYIRPGGSKGESCAYVEVNLLGNSTRSEENNYDRENLQGLMAEILNRDFCIYKTGNEGKVDDDDGSMIGTMQLLSHDQIKVSDFGLTDTNTEVYQSVAEAHYEMYYTTE